jgi:hypothetical protein
MSTSTIDPNAIDPADDVSTFAAAIKAQFTNAKFDLEFQSTIEVGTSHTLTGTLASITGGNLNVASGNYSHVGGGRSNEATLIYGTVCGGWSNDSHGTGSFIGGGLGNVVGASAYSTICGGDQNNITASRSFIGGGLTNVISGLYSFIGGGVSNLCSGDYSTAGGNRSKSELAGQFVFSDSGLFDWSNTVDTTYTWLLNQMNLRYANGYRFCTGYNGSGVPTSGVQALAGTNAWSTLSDENKKTNFKELDHIETLERVSDMYVSDWQYKTDAETNKHYYGPTAQDFHRIFNLGGDQLSIDTQQNIGVLYSAIKGLIQEIDTLKAEIKSLK